MQTPALAFETAGFRAIAARVSDHAECLSAHRTLFRRCPMSPRLPRTYHRAKALLLITTVARKQFAALFARLWLQATFRMWALAGLFQSLNQGALPCRAFSARQIGANRRAVLGLLGACRPTAIARTVRAIVIDALQGQTVGTWRHISNECFDDSPTFAHGDAASSVPAIHLMRWLMAPSHHLPPDAEQGMTGQAVRFPHMRDYHVS